MKNLLLSFLCLLPFLTSAENQYPIGSKVQSVTIYLQGAEVNRKGNAVSIPAGQSQLVFTDLSSELNPSSIQVTGTGDAVVLSATFQINYLGSNKDQSEVKALKDSIDMVTMNIAVMDNQLAVLQGQEDLLNNNKSVGGANTGVTAAQLQAVYEFYISSMSKIKSDELSVNQKRKTANELLQKLTNQLNQWNSTGSKPTGEVIVDVQAKSATTASLNLSYVINNAGWTPEYDLRSTDIKSAMTINYKAKVWQNSESDWKNVKLTLSTGNPTISATGPVLSPWYLYFYQPAYYENYNNAPSMAPSTVYMDKSVEKDADGIQTAAQYTTVVETQMTTEFDIDLPYTIPADGKTHFVSIQDYTLPANYYYYAIPKLDADAFLIAEVTDWGKLNLLPGTANIFFGGTYVGQSYLAINSTTDTMTFSLGRDKGILITRDKVKDYSKVKTIGDNKEQSFAWTIAVKNNKSAPIEIRIYDQIPITTTSEIKISSDDLGGAMLDTETGKMTWKLSLAAGANKNLRFTYTVRYPKNQVIQGL